MVDLAKIKPVVGASYLAQVPQPWVVWGNVMVQSDAPVVVVERRYCSNVGQDPLKIGGVVMN